MLIPDSAGQASGIVFIFVDGLGLAPAGESNPIRKDICPTLHELLETRSRPLDATLGVKGLPQSATGQTALFTGINAPAKLGKHVEGFPGPALRRIIEQDNLFLRLARMGGKCRFANAYSCDSAEEVSNRRYRSVTTTMALTSPATLSFRSDLLADRALAHDLTRESRRPADPALHTIAPKQAACHLASLAGDYSLTLFEYFLTDRIGHKRDFQEACRILRTLDEFLAALIRKLVPAGRLFVLCSDHGNIENMHSPRHTANPVPLAVQGPAGEKLLQETRSLTDVTPTVASLFETGTIALHPGGRSG